MAFDEQSDITFHYTGDEKFGFSFNLRLMFQNDDTQNQNIKTKINGNTIEFICTNFLSAGTGTENPLKLASSKGKNMYIRFWSYLEGDMEGRKKTRKVEYTFFLGKQVVE